MQKDNPNKGRRFYTCPKPQHECCNFFKWADDTSPVGDGRLNGSTWGSASRGKGAGRDLPFYAKILVYDQKIFHNHVISYFLRREYKSLMNDISVKLTHYANVSSSTE